MSHLPSRRRGRYAVAAMTAAGLTLLTACGGSGSTEGADEPLATDEPITISFSWWGNDDRAALTEQAIDLFEEAHPNITVETSYAAFGDYTQRLSTQLAGGGAPDLFAAPVDSMRQYIDNGLVADLEDVGVDVEVDGIPEQWRDIARTEDGLYGVPFGRATSGVIYDPAAWDASGVTPGPDWSWEDLEKGSLAIREASGGSKAGFTDFGKQTEWFEIYLISEDKALYDADGELGFDVDDVADFWGMAGRMRENGAATPPEVTTLADGSMANSPLVTGASAADFAATSLVGSYTDAFGQVAVAPLPSSGDHLGVFAGATSMAAISERSDAAHQAAAATFLDFFINDVEAGKVLGLTRGLPPSQEVLDALAPELAGADRQLYDYESSVLEEVQPFPALYPEGYAASKAEFMRIYDDLMFDRVSIDDAAEQAYSVFESNLSH
jgi:multiple sugar transport system substrate-binding protein